MPLISCPDCGSSVSDRAPACLKCGAPIFTAGDIRQVGTTLTTTQETSKRLKLHVAFSAILIICGVVWGISSAQTGYGIALGPVLTGTIGFAWYMVTRLRIWWHHK